MEHLANLFQKLKQSGIIINPAKCQFGDSENDFWGYNITYQVFSTISTKVDAILNHVKPKTIKDLRKYLAMINFYRLFIPKAAEHQILLNDYLKGATKNDKTLIIWTPEAEKAFEQTKKDIENTAHLSYPLKDAKLILKVDASDFAIGAVLKNI